MYVVINGLEEHILKQLDEEFSGKDDRKKTESEGRGWSRIGTPDIPDESANEGNGEDENRDDELSMASSQNGTSAFCAGHSYHSSCINLSIVWNLSFSLACA